MKKGEKMTNELRKKLSLIKTGKKLPPFSNEHRKNLSLAQTGKKYSEDDRKKMSISHLGKKRGPHSEEHKEKLRQWHLKNPHKHFKDTKIELKIEKELQKRNILYQKQVPLCKIAIVDFYLPESKTVIQSDGCFYHNCPIHYPKYHLNSRPRSEKQDAVLVINGYKVYRFWEHEINKSAEKCLDKVSLRTIV